MVRVKMHLWKISSMAGSETKILNFQCSYDPQIPEDQRFQKATPSGNAEFYVDNPLALEQFELGKNYYIDFSPVK